MQASQLHVSGSGPCLVLLNGTYQSMDSWTAVAKKLESRFTVVRFNFPGQDKADTRQPCSTFEQLCTFTRDTLASLSTRSEELSIFGLSMGAQVAHALTTDLGMKFRHVLLGGYMPPVLARFKKTYFSALKQALLTDGLSAFSRLLCFTVFSPLLFQTYAGAYEFILNSFRLQYQGREQALSDLLDLSRQSSAWAPSSQSLSRTHLVYGEHDSLVPQPIAKSFAQEHNAAMTLVERCGHSFPIENVDGTVDSIQACLAIT